MEQRHMDVPEPVMQPPPVEGMEAPKPEYEPPQVMTFRGAEIHEALGPAHACSFNHSVLLC